MSNLENRVVKKKKLDKDLTLRVLKNEVSERIFVEFATENNRLFLQKSFQDNFQGRQEAEQFQNTIQSVEDLKNYFKPRSK